MPKTKRKQPTVMLYVRIPKDVHDNIERAAFHRGFPNTIASVSAEALCKHFGADK